MLHQIKALRVSRRYITIEMPVAEAQKYLDALDNVKTSDMMPRWRRLQDELRKALE